MNIRTTLLLAVAVMVVAGAYLGYHWRLTQEKSTPQDRQTALTDQTTQSDRKDRSTSLTQPPLSDRSSIVKVEFQSRGRTKLAFERRSPASDEESAQIQWDMVEPTRCRATDWMVNNVVLAVKGLNYVSKFNLKSPDAITLEKAGLAPEPLARLAVTTQEGQRVEVQVGDAAIGKNYVYLPSRPDVLFIAEGDFGNILDRDPTQFRDRQIADFPVMDVVELMIEQHQEGQSALYHLLKTDNQWRFTAPFKAQADSGKIQNVVANLSRLWARDWLEETSAKLADFGLEPSFLTLTVVTEKKVPKPKSTETQPTTDATPTTQDTEPEFDLVRQEHIVHLSNQKPIDDQNQVYAKRGSDEQIGTINAAELAKFTPDLTSWRDLRITQQPLSQATALTLTYSDETVALHKQDQQWYFSSDDQPADGAVVADLLTRLENLKAVNYVEGVDAAHLTQYGLSQPAVLISLTMTDSTEPQLIRIGDFSEQIEKRLRYLQVGSSTSIAKVKSKELESLLQGRQTFYSRDIVDQETSRLFKIDITRPASGTDRPETIVLQRDSHKVWQMTAPINSEVDLTPVNDLAAKLADLKALAVVNELNPTNLGLDKPEVQVTLTFEGIPTLQLPDSQPTPSTDDEAEANVQDIQPQPAEPVSYQLLLGRKDNKAFAQNIEKVIFYEIPFAVYESLLAEFMPGEFWKFEPSQVTSVIVTEQGKTVGLEKKSEKWTYLADADIPIDAKKVQDHINQIRHLRTVRYMDYQATDLKSYGLDSPQYALRLVLENGETRELFISPRTTRRENTDYHYAKLAESDRVFLLGSAAVKNSLITLERLEPSTESEKISPPPAAPVGPGSHP